MNFMIACMASRGTRKVERSNRWNRWERAKRCCGLERGSNAQLEREKDMSVFQGIGFSFFYTERHKAE